MAGLAEARTAAEYVVKDVCKSKPRSFEEAEVGRILHAFLLGRQGGVVPEAPAEIGGGKSGNIDFRFGDWPYGASRMSQCCFQGDSTHPVADDWKSTIYVETEFTKKGAVQWFGVAVGKTVE